MAGTAFYNSKVSISPPPQRWEVQDVLDRPSGLQDNNPDFLYSDLEKSLQKKTHTNKSFVVQTKKTCISEEDKARIAMQVEALLMSLNVSLIRIRTKLGEPNASPELAAMEMQYQNLQQRAEFMLLSLSDTSAHQCLNVLRSEEACLKVMYDKCVHNVDKVNAATSAPQCTQAQMEKDIQAHPLMMQLTLRRLNLDALLVANKNIKIDINDITSGGADLASAIHIATAVAAAGGVGGAAAAAAAIQQAANVMAQQAQAAEDDAIAHGATNDDIISRRAQMRAAIEARAKRIHSAAVDITANGKDGVVAAYDQFIAKPAQSLKAKYPDYCDKAKLHIGERADAWRTNMDALSAHIEKMRERFMNSDNLKEMAGIVDALSPLTGGCSYDLSTQAQMINGDIRQVEEAQRALADTLSGKSDDIGAAATLLGQSRKSLRDQVVQFRADHGINKSHPVVKLLCMDVDELWDKIRGRDSQDKSGHDHHH